MAVDRRTALCSCAEMRGSDLWSRVLGGGATVVWFTSGGPDEWLVSAVCEFDDMLWSSGIGLSVHDVGGV